MDRTDGHIDLMIEDSKIHFYFNIFTKRPVVELRKLNLYKKREARSAAAKMALGRNKKGSTEKSFR